MRLWYKKNTDIKTYEWLSYNLNELLPASQKISKENEKGK